MVIGVVITMIVMEDSLEEELQGVMVLLIIISGDGRDDDDDDGDG